MVTLIILLTAGIFSLLFFRALSLRVKKLQEFSRRVAEGDFRPIPVENEGGALEDPKNSRRFLEIIRDHAVRLSQLTNDLLKLSQIETGKLELQLRPMAMPDLIDACLETARFKAEPKGLDIDQSVPGDIAEGPR
jgi:signal transduction histidine kinase